MFFDTHAHLQSVEFDRDREVVIGAFGQGNVSGCLCAGTDLESSQQAVALAGKHAKVWAAVGFHPSNSNNFDENAFAGLYQLAKENPKVVAVGEIGLDYHYANTNIEKQKSCFARQIALANILQKPYIVHLRDAFVDFDTAFLPLYPKYGAVIHCFSGDMEQALRYVDKGYHISFSGIVTYKNADVVREALEFVPMDRLLIETDCPYLSPVPYRGQRNDPTKIQYIAQEVAVIKGKSVKEIANITTQNAKKLFGIQ